MRNIIIAGLLIFIFGCFVVAVEGIRPLIVFHEIKATSSDLDAIAIRVLPNPKHFSAFQWYENQGFSGSPQSIMIDGYRGVREGRTVYVNVGNVIEGTLYTNIYLMSYNQKPTNETQDIFGRILNKWKFNTNISEQSNCENALQQICRLDSDCPIGDFCAGEQAKIRRDVYRLEVINKIKSLLESFRQNNSHYPSLSSGSYLPHKTISVWPSWSGEFSRELGAVLPGDPVNRLGECGEDRFDSKTCWDANAQEFADADMTTSELDLPAGSRVFVYESSNNTANYSLCGYFESSYRVVDSGDFCILGEMPNRPPVLTGVNLTNAPDQEYFGYLSAMDPDGDELVWSYSLENPVSADGWEAMGWNWVDGYAGFELTELDNLNQVMLRAEKAGFTTNTGYYQINVGVSDGRGGVTSRDLDIDLHFYDMELSSGYENAIIGQPASVSLEGTDNSRRPLQDLLIDSLRLDGLPVNFPNDHGFSISGMTLNESFVEGQRTGQYSFDVYSLDPISGNRVDSNIAFDVVNNPPEITSAEVNFEDGTSRDCNSNIACSFVIYNQESIDLQVSAHDGDVGHNVSFAILDNPGTLSVNDSGLITGFENLNIGSLEAHNYSFNVEATDQYCNQSEQSECRDVIEFDFEIMPFCSVNNVVSAETFELVEPFEIAESGNSLPIGNSLSDCREAGNSTMDITISGQGSDQAIVFVLDISNSMRTIVDGEAAIDRAKNALVSDGGVLDNLFSFANSIPNTIQVGIIAYNSEVRSVYPLSDITMPGIVDDIKSTVNSYNAHAGTHTLDALNEAELLLEGVTDINTDKIVLLMSDGYPVIRTTHRVYECRESPCGCGSGCYSRTDSPGLCYFDGSRSENCCTAGRSYCYNRMNCCPGTPGPVK